MPRKKELPPEQPQKSAIARRRMAAGIRQQKVADLPDLSVSQYSRVEREPHKFDYGDLQKIAHLLGCTVPELVEDVAPDIEPMARVMRVLAVYDMRQSDWSKGSLVKIAEYSPSATVSEQSYAIEQYDDSMMGGDPRTAILKGDTCVVDPSEELTPGCIVHALDPAGGRSMIRFYTPLHPSNPRAPGYVLKPANPAFDDVFVSVKGRKGILGVVVEKRVDFRK